MTSILIELQRSTPACEQQAWSRILASAKWEPGVAMGKFFSDPVSIGKASSGAGCYEEPGGG